MLLGYLSSSQSNLLLLWQLQNIIWDWSMTTTLRSDLSARSAQNITLLTKSRAFVCHPALNRNAKELPTVSKGLLMILLLRNEYRPRSCHICLIQSLQQMLLRPSFVNNLVPFQDSQFDKTTWMYDIQDSPAYNSLKIGLKQVVDEDGNV